MQRELEEQLRHHVQAGGQQIPVSVGLLLRAPVGHHHRGHAPDVRGLPNHEGPGMGNGATGIHLE